MNKRIWALPLCMVLSAYACAAPQGGSISAPTISTIEQISLPLDSYQPDADQLTAIGARYLSSVNSCLSKRTPPERAHIDHGSMKSFAAGLVRDRHSRSDAWGFFDTSSYKKFGYHRPPGQPAALELATTPATADISECAKTAGNFITDFERNNLPGQGPKTPEDQREFRDAVELWKSCMGDAGIETTSPRDLAANPKWYSGPVSPDEIRVAEQDIRCKVVTNLVGISVEIQSRYDNQYIADHQEELRTWTRQFRS